MQPCCRTGCPVLVDRGYCDACRPKQNRRTEAGRSPAAHRELYHSAAWQRLRTLKLRADPFCEIRTHCAEGPLIRTLASEVDHRIPVALRPDLRLVYSNLQSSCKPCHSAKTAAEQRQAKGKDNVAIAHLVCNSIKGSSLNVTDKMGMKYLPAWQRAPHAGQIRATAVATQGVVQAMRVDVHGSEPGFFLRKPSPSASRAA